MWPLPPTVTLHALSMQADTWRLPFKTNTAQKETKLNNTRLRGVTEGFITLQTPEGDVFPWRIGAWKRGDNADAIHLWISYTCSTWAAVQNLENGQPRQHYKASYTLRKKGTKAVTGAVPFQKVNFYTQRLHIATLVVHVST